MNRGPIALESDPGLKNQENVISKLLLDAANQMQQKEAESCDCEVCRMLRETRQTSSIASIDVYSLPDEVQH